MGYYYSRLLFLAMLLVLSLPMKGSFACDLPPNFYEKACPCLFSTVKDVVRSAISKEARMGASLVRLFFHDCFVNGCDGSLLLDDTATLKGEKTAPPNNNSVRGFEVIDAIKAKVEEVCPGVVSCADILAIAARDSTEILGGPSWTVRLGRRDARTASFSATLTNLPPPTFDLAELIARFQSKGLSATDMVALSGSHTIGLSRCIGFRGHIYNDSNINPSFAALRQSNCPRAAGSGDFNLAPLDARTPTLFDNAYFINLVEKKGLLHSDQELFNGGSSDALVLRYSHDRAAFFSDFAKAMIKMGNLSPLTGSQGEIRRNCRRVN